VPRLTWVSEGKPLFRLLLGSKKEVIDFGLRFHDAPPFAFHGDRYFSPTHYLYLMANAILITPRISGNTKREAICVVRLYALVMWQILIFPNDSISPFATIQAGQPCEGRLDSGSDRQDY